MSSNVSTPLLEPFTSQTLQPPSPSPLAQQSSAHLDDIPPLSLDVLTSRDDKVDALKLIADSVAQQRQTASLHLVFHPLSLAVLAAALAAAYQLARRKDPGTAMALASGVVMSYLMAIRYLTSGYIRQAEALDWAWLAGANADPATDTDTDTVIGTRFGREMIGALVLRLEPAPGAAAAGTGGGRRRASARSGGGLRGGRGVVRAWTTKLRYRRRGVGADLLHEAVRVTRERCGRDAEVGFAQEHANSEMVLPEMFNTPFRKREMHAAKALETVLGDWEGNKRKR